MSKLVVAALKPGDPVKVRGVHVRGLDMVSAVSLQAGDAAPIVDNGPPKPQGAHKEENKPKPEPRKSAAVAGVVKHVLHGSRGEKGGILFEDGTIVRMSAHAAESLHGKLAARGDRLTNALGTVIDAREIGLSLAALYPVEPKTHGERRPPKHDEEALKRDPPT
jgi:hypothetical protein